MLFSGEINAVLFVFLCSAKKLAKQHPTGFEYEIAQRCRKKVKARLCKSAEFLLQYLVIDYILSKKCPWRWHMAQENWQKYKLLNLLGLLRQRQQS